LDSSGGIEVRIPNASQLAVMLRSIQWLVDDAAHKLPTGQAPPDELIALAKSMEETAQCLRYNAESPLVIDQIVSDHGDREAGTTGATDT
jgi:hypothetical protein